MYNTNHQAHLEAASKAIAKNPDFIPAPFMFDAQMSYTASSSEWRRLVSVKAHVMRHADRAIIEKFTEREAELRKAHTLELQVFFNLGVVPDTVGAVPVYPFDSGFKKLFDAGYGAGLNGTQHELGLISNVAAYRDVCEDTMPVCSIITLAAGRINELATEFNSAVWKASDTEEAELDTMRVDELHTQLRIWCSLLTIHPRNYPSLGLALLNETYPTAIADELMEYFHNEPNVMAYVFLDAAKIHDNQLSEPTPIAPVEVAVGAVD